MGCQSSSIESLANRILEQLDSRGPLSGKELIDATGLDEFIAWKTCYVDERITTKTIGTRYLRLDRQVEGFARLSPSIIREFYGYTVIGTKDNQAEILKRAQALHQEILQISQRKFDLAREVIASIVESQADPQGIKDNACFIIAGDVAYGMSHLEPRPEISTGELVRGSDLDIVVIAHGLSASSIAALDQSIYKQKNFLLRNPSYNEEIDYLIKDIAKIEEQLRFDSFESMVAAKILLEGQFLYGNAALFKQIKTKLDSAGISENIRLLENEAEHNRTIAISHLLECGRDLIDEESAKLFFTKEEREEFF